MKRPVIVATIALALLTAGARAEAALIVFNSAAAFDAANPGLPVETFESGGTVTQTFSGPLNSTTNNGIFSPGDILPGITITDFPGADPDELFVAAPGQSSNPTTAIGSDFPPEDALDILLNPGVTAVGFQIFQNFGGGAQAGTPQSYTVSVFNAGGLIQAFPTIVPSGAAGFFGVRSTIAGEITRISILGPDAFEVIDNVRFGGGAAAAVPEPASMLLLGTGLLGGSYRRWRRRNG